MHNNLIIRNPFVHNQTTEPQRVGSTTWSHSYFLYQFITAVSSSFARCVCVFAVSIDNFANNMLIFHNTNKSAFVV